MTCREAMFQQRRAMYQALLESDQDLEPGQPEMAEPAPPVLGTPPARRLSENDKRGANAPLIAQAAEPSMRVGQLRSSQEQGGMQSDLSADLLTDELVAEVADNGADPNPAQPATLRDPLLEFLHQNTEELLANVFGTEQQLRQYLDRHYWYEVPANAWERYQQFLEANGARIPLLRKRTRPDSGGNDDAEGHRRRPRRDV